MISINAKDRKMKKIKTSRAASFAIITLIYAAASVLGIFLYRALNTPWWLSLLISDLIATLFVFIFSVILDNASVYDPYWSVQPIVILAAFAFKKELTLIRALMLIAVSLWGIRLTANWAYTFGDLTHQDWRYTMLEEKTGSLYPVINLLGIHIVPTLVVYGCIIPAAFVFVHDGVPTRPLSVVFIALSVAAFTLQGIADIEMHKYRKNRSTPFIRVGLWKNSRHPNYLGEILMWWGVGLAAFASVPDAPHLILGAMANTVLFLFVSIPMADKRQSRKEGFSEYVKETRMLLPIPKFKK